MANGKITLGKQSGGELALVIPDGVSNTEVIIPESGELATKDYADLKVALADFIGTNVNLANSGYQKLPSGLIIQWGMSAGVLLNTIGTYTYSVTLPIAFPNNVFCAVASHVGTSSALSSGVSINGFTNTQVTISFQNARSDQNVYARYIIIGN